MGTQHRLHVVARHITSAATAHVGPIDVATLTQPDSGRTLTTVEKQSLFENGCEDPAERDEFLLAVIAFRGARCSRP